MRVQRLARIVGGAALLAALALPGTAAAQGRLPAVGGGIAGGGGAAALSVSFAFAPTAQFPSATGAITVSPSRVDVSLAGTNLLPGAVVCLLKNAAPIACTQPTPTGGITFPHLPLAAFSSAPGTTFSVTRGTASTSTTTIASVTLP